MQRQLNGTDDKTTLEEVFSWNRNGVLYSINGDNFNSF